MRESTANNVKMKVTALFICSNSWIKAKPPLAELPSNPKLLRTACHVRKCAMT